MVDAEAEQKEGSLRLSRNLIRIDPLRPNGQPLSKSHVSLTPLSLHRANSPNPLVRPPLIDSQEKGGGVMEGDEADDHTPFEVEARRTRGCPLTNGAYPHSIVT